MASLRLVPLAISLTLTIAACAPLYYRTHSDERLHLSARAACSIQGNSDFYGLGIRIGIYLQWVTSFLANHLLEDAIWDNLTTNTIFLLALFVALVVATVEGSVQPAEVVVLLQLCFGFLFSILSIWGLRTRYRARQRPVRFPLLSATFRLMIATAISIYSAWFWIHDAAISPAAGRCSYYTFFFAKLDLHGPMRIILSVQSMLVMLVYCTLLANELLMLTCFFVYTVAWATTFAACMVTLQGPHIYYSLRPENTHFRDIPGRKRLHLCIKVALRMLKLVAMYSTAIAWKRINGTESAGRNRPKLHTQVFFFVNTCILFSRTFFHVWCLVLFRRSPPVDFPPMLNIRAWLFLRKITHWSNVVERGPPYVRRLLWTSNAICIVWAIISVESTLAWNYVSGVYDLRTTGQLIPFIIGIVGLLKLLHSISVHRSAVTTTDILLQLFGVSEVGVTEDKLGMAKVLKDAEVEKQFPTRFVARRQSINIPPTQHDPHAAAHLHSKGHDLEDITSSSYHIDNRFHPRRLQAVYGKDNVVGHRMSNGKDFWIISDFTRLSPRQRAPEERRGRSRHRERAQPYDDHAASSANYDDLPRQRNASAPHPLRPRQSSPTVRSSTASDQDIEAISQHTEAHCQQTLSDLSDSHTSSEEEDHRSRTFACVYGVCHRRPHVLRRLLVPIYRYLAAGVRAAGPGYLELLRQHMRQRLETVEYWIMRGAHAVLNACEQIIAEASASGIPIDWRKGLAQHAPEHIQAFSRDLGMWRRVKEPLPLISRLFTVRKKGSPLGSWSDFFERWYLIHERWELANRNQTSESQADEQADTNQQSSSAAQLNPETTEKGGQQDQAPTLPLTKSRDNVPSLAASGQDRGSNWNDLVVGAPRSPSCASRSRGRPINAAELWSLHRFEDHSRDCSACLQRHSELLSKDLRLLCSSGHQLLEDVATELYCTGGITYSTTRDSGKTVPVELPPHYEFIATYLEVKSLEIQLVGPPMSPNAGSQDQQARRSRNSSTARVWRQRGHPNLRGQGSWNLRERPRSSSRSRSRSRCKPPTSAHPNYSAVSESDLELQSIISLDPTTAQNEFKIAQVYLEGLKLAIPREVTSELLKFRDIRSGPGREYVAAFALFAVLFVPVVGYTMWKKLVPVHQGSLEEVSVVGQEDTESLTTAYSSRRRARTNRVHSDEASGRYRQRHRSNSSGLSLDSRRRASRSISRSRADGHAEAGSRTRSRRRSRDRSRSRSCSCGRNCSYSPSSSRSRITESTEEAKFFTLLKLANEQQSFVASAMDLLSPASKFCAASGCNRVGRRIKRVKAFLDAAKETRSRKQEIGKTAQHDEVSESWDRIIGEHLLWRIFTDFFEDLATW